MRLMKCVLTSGMIALLLTSPLAISAQWDKKPYTEWTDADVQKMLNNSPWSRTHTVTTARALFRSPSSQQPAAQPGTIAPPNSVYVNFRVRFFSAKPIRQALSRMIELQKKKGMDEQLAGQLKAFAAGEFLDYIIVTVTCDSSEPGANFQEALGLLQKTGTGEIKNDTFLETKGGHRVFLQEYQTPHSDGFGARFIFPRLVDGKPFITAEGDEVRFYSHLSDTYKLDQRFKIKNMVYDGKLEY